MNFIIRTVALGMLFVSASAALGAEDAAIGVIDSRKDTEIRIAKILKEKLKVNSTLKNRGDDAEDQVLQIPIAANKERGLPQVVYVIDTRVIRRSKDGKAISQVIGIDSVGDIKVAADKVGELLKWANKWNSATLPIRIYVGGDRIVVGQNLLVTTQAPVSENQLISIFRTIVQLWPVLLKDLRENKFIQ